VYCYFFIVETRGLSLEETAALFDGAEAERHIAGAGMAHVERRNDDIEDKVATP
jgi:hypothetical protein